MMIHLEKRYRPDEADPDAVKRLLHANSFATMVSRGVDEPMITHLPVLADYENGRLERLRAHVSRANAHWKLFAEDPMVNILFQGAHAYVSPGWYTVPSERAPTWNYAVVHVRGRARIITDMAWTNQQMDDLVMMNEAQLDCPWQVGTLNPIRRAALQAGIVAFQIDIERLDVKFKLNQHNTSSDKRGAIVGLRSRGDDGSNGIATLMSAFLDPDPA